MKYIRIPAGIYAANCYIIYSESDGAGIIVDPAGDAEDLIKIIEDNKIEPKYILLTHGHADHIGAVEELKEKYSLELLIHEDDLDMIEDSKINLSSSMAMGNISLKADRLLKDGDVIPFGNSKGRVIHTPGHTKGGICFLTEGLLVTGDTLFKGSVGRSDLYGGDHDVLVNSILSKLMILPDDIIVMPGHGQESTILRERMSNPFLR